MDGSSLLQGIGIFVCVGAIILVALVAFAARSLMGQRNQNQQNPNMWNTRGDERPTYDDPNVQSRGGFGGVPTTGRRDNTGLGQEQPRGGNRNAGFGGTPPAGGAQNYGDRDSGRDRSRADDDDVRSSGGFGGG